MPLNAKMTTNVMWMSENFKNPWGATRDNEDSRQHYKSTGVQNGEIKKFYDVTECQDDSQCHGDVSKCKKLGCVSGTRGTVDLENKNQPRRIKIQNMKTNVINSVIRCQEDKECQSDVTGVIGTASSVDLTENESNVRMMAQGW